MSTAQEIELRINKFRRLNNIFFWICVALLAVASLMDYLKFAFWTALVSNILFLTILAAGIVSIIYGIKRGTAYN